MPGELEFCKAKVVELKGRVGLLEKQIRNLEKQLHAQEYVYLAEMRRMRRTVTLDAISDALSIIPFQSSLEQLTRGGKLTNANKDKLLKLIAALETSFQAALAADATSWGTSTLAWREARTSMSSSTSSFLGPVRSYASPRW